MESCSSLTVIIQHSKGLDTRFDRPDEPGLHLELAVLLLSHSVGQSVPGHGSIQGGSKFSPTH